MFVVWLTAVAPDFLRQAIPSTGKMNYVINQKEINVSTEITAVNARVIFLPFSAESTFECGKH
jgi:hypothetical protein